ncbi:nuclear factor erythroid 2-related factor 2a [Erpetoichthys calabaricus]|nr:nuclear factor erythroid 2-related factor 2a [Erpetoichthys calabaricus]
MMELELPKTQQDMDLIDILWRQDIDLGAGREVFDYIHRQKECELEKQKKLEEERQEQVQQEKEKAWLSQLHLDEETGEFVPRPAPPSKPESPPLSSEQNVPNAEEVLSFDMCMQLLAETFPLVDEVQVASQPPAPEPTEDSQVLLAPLPPPQTQDPVLMSPFLDSKSEQDMEQAWQELLSIPELQDCLNMQNTSLIDMPSYANSSKPQEVQDANYNFYVAEPPDVLKRPNTGCPAGFLGAYDGPYPAGLPPEPVSQMTVNALDLNGSFLFYPDLMNPKPNNSEPLVPEVDASLTEILSDSPMDFATFSMEEPFTGKTVQEGPDIPDSDSGVSMDSSPKAPSPGNSLESSLYKSASFTINDSDMEELDSNPGSVQAEYAEMFPVSYHIDEYQVPVTTSQSTPLSTLTSDETDSEPPGSPGYLKTPFTKDKSRSRLEARLSRDEQRAKVLQIPFAIEKIINLPVEDFNELMSKHQLNESQLSLIRDIRRRGKNKVAAQNCRKRKMENIVGLECELDSLKNEKEKLLKEKGEQHQNLRQLKQQLNSLYLEVFSMLRDEDGKPYSPSEYSLQQTSDGSVFLVPRSKKAELKKEKK